MLHASLMGGILQVLLEWTVLLMSVALIGLLANHVLNRGTLCGGIGHELGDPLKIIKGTHVRNVISGVLYVLHFMHSVCQYGVV